VHRPLRHPARVPARAPRTDVELRQVRGRRAAPAPRGLHPDARRAAAPRAGAGRAPPLPRGRAAAAARVQGRSLCGVRRMALRIFLPCFLLADAWSAGALAAADVVRSYGAVPLVAQRTAPVSI